VGVVELPQATHRKLFLLDLRAANVAMPVKGKTLQRDKATIPVKVLFEKSSHFVIPFLQPDPY
jgi:hypothetical protein